MDKIHLNSMNKIKFGERKLISISSQSLVWRLYNEGLPLGEYREFDDIYIIEKGKDFDFFNDKNICLILTKEETVLLKKLDIEFEQKLIISAIILILSMITTFYFKNINFVFFGLIGAYFLERSFSILAKEKETLNNIIDKYLSKFY